MKMKKIDIAEYLSEALHLRDRQVVDFLEERAVVEPVKKRDQIFVIGKRPEYVALAVDGVFRAFYVNEDDVEVTDCLVGTPGESLMPGFDLDAPAPATMEALTKGAVFKIRLADFRQLMRMSPAVGSIYQDMIQRAGQYHLEKGRVISSYMAEKKYRWFLETHGDLDNRIPDKYIASYLHMSPVTLSQIKKHLREAEEAEA